MIVVVTKKGVVVKLKLKDFGDKKQFKLSEDDEVVGVTWVNTENSLFGGNINIS